MLHNIYSVKDTKAEAFLPPWYAPTNASAIRSFSTAVNDSTHDFAKYPSDFVLYQLGSFDDNTGVITAMEPHVLGVAIDFLKLDN